MKFRQIELIVCLKITLDRSYVIASITVTKVGVLSIGKLFGTVNLIIGLAVGIVATVAGIIAYFAADNYGFFEGLLGSIGIALAALVLYPLVMFASDGSMVCSLRSSSTSLLV